MAETLLYVALDKSDRPKNLELAYELHESGAEGEFGFKANQDDITIGGEAYLSSLVEIGRPVFADLKMNNGPRTMANTIEYLADLGVAHTNIWAHAESNLRKTVDRLADVSERPGILAVTFYTRWNEAYAQAHHHMSLDELINHMAHVGVENGADGIILPGNLMGAVADLDTIKLNPAVRMEGEVTDSEQEQVTTPYDAVMAGSDILVVGSPIYKAEFPAQALGAYLSEMRRGEADLAALSPA